jgi:hypothetical protein
MKLLHLPCLLLALLSNLSLRAQITAPPSHVLVATNLGEAPQAW